jgi:hypothetical protein
MYYPMASEDSKAAGGASSAFKVGVSSQIAFQNVSTDNH